MVKVDESKCIGCGACVSVAPENFDFHEFNFITKILMQYLLNDSMLDSLLGMTKD